MCTFHGFGIVEVFPIHQRLTVTNQPQLCCIIVIDGHAGTQAVFRQDDLLSVDVLVDGVLFEKAVLQMLDDTFQRHGLNFCQLLFDDGHGQPAIADILVEVDV